MTTQRNRSTHDASDKDSVRNEQPEQQPAPVDRRLIAAMAGHELREPINAIISFLNVTVQERLGPLNALQSEFLRSTESAARRLERRIDDVQVALLEGDALKLHRAWIDPNRRVVATCRELEWAAEKYETKVLMNLERSTRNPGTWADADRLAQILSNVIENAIRYAPAGTEVRVSTSFREHGYWTFIVENDLEQDQQFSTANWFLPGDRSTRANDRQRPGLGLGLTIAKYLVEAHQGEIWADIVDSKVQVGFSIPHHKR